MKNKIQKILVGAVFVSMLLSSLGGCSVRWESPSQSGSVSSSSQSGTAPSGQPEQEAYSIDVPDEGWNQVSPGLWAAVEDSKVLTNVRIWVVSFEGQTMEEAEKSLAADDYQTDGVIEREKDGVSTKAALHESGGSTWGLFYSYPTDEAGKWETILSEIAETFRLTGR